MSDDNGGREVAVAPSRAVRVVESDVAIFDTGRFEHLYRVATVLTEAQLLPETLTHTGPAAKREMLPYDTIKARAFLIASQADRWNMDPMAVAQATAIVHNRLMYEGKLVHAVLEARLGVRLNYRYNDAKGDALAIEVFATLPGEIEPRVVRGTVGQWKTVGNNSPWGNPQNHPKMLAYRGSREFARLHAPGIILGVITDDEIEEVAARAIAQPPKSLANAYDATPEHDADTGEVKEEKPPAPKEEAKTEPAKPTPAAEPKPEPPPATVATLDDYEAMVAAAETAKAVTDAHAALRASPLWADAEAEGRRTWTVIAGQKLDELGTRGVAIPLPKNDPGIFRIWVSATRRDPAKVNGNFATLMRAESFRNLPEAEQEELMALAAVE